MKEETEPSPLAKLEWLAEEKTLEKSLDLLNTKEAYYNGYLDCGETMLKDLESVRNANTELHLKLVKEKIKSTALESDLERLREENERLKQIVLECKPKVLHCYEQSSRNGAHQEFLSEDRDLMRRMEDVIENKH